MARRFLTLLIGLSVGMLFAAGEPLQGQPLAKAVKTSRPTLYEIEMTTTFVVPVGNEKIDRVRVYHALPTLRAWSPAKAEHGATKLGFTPKTAEEESHEETESRYLLWTTDGKQKPGTKLVFSSTLTVASPDRTLDLGAVQTGWKDYATPPEDKTAVVDPAVVKAVHPEVAKVAARFKADLPPAQAVQAMCKWIVDNFKYDASVTFATSDVENILKNKCGHCGHQATLLQELTASAGIPLRTVWGMNLYAPDGRTSELQTVRADFTNVHTWSEVYFPQVGWVEVDPGLGSDAFSLPAQYIQNNLWFQNYAIWLREAGVDKEATWTPVRGGFRSDYGVENIIRFSRKKNPLPVTAAPVPNGPKKESASDWEHKAVAFGADEKEGTRKLNDLARDGWEYVGPLGNGLVAFKRSTLSPRDAAARKDREKLRGTWYTVSISNGDTETGEDKADTITYDGGTFVQRLNGEVRQAGTFEIIDAAAVPKQIEYTATVGPSKGTVWRSIYTLDGDEHKICSDDGNDNRPKEFSGKAGFLRVTRREKN